MNVWSKNPNSRSALITPGRIVIVMLVAVLVWVLVGHSEAVAQEGYIPRTAPSTHIDFVTNDIERDSVGRSWMGRKSSELMMAWGSPKDVKPDGGSGTIYSFDYMRDVFYGPDSAMVKARHEVAIKPVAFSFYADSTGAIYHFGMHYVDTSQQDAARGFYLILLVGSLIWLLTV